MGVECTAQDHKLFNRSKGLIYIRDFSMENVASFRQGMKMKYHASEVAEARWIKPRNEQHTAWLVTFNKESLPEAVDIPGEQTITKV